MGKKRKNSSGQALLIVLLVMAASLTVVLSIASRSVTDIAVTSVDDDSLRAFSAAEAGVERALVADAPTTISEPDLDPAVGTSFNASVTAGSISNGSFTYPALFSGESATFWLVEHDQNGDLSCAGGSCSTTNLINVCWGKSGASNNSDTTPAIEVSIFYDQVPGQAIGPSQDFSQVSVARTAFDPHISPSPPRSNNSFDPAVLCPDANFAFSTGDINLATLGISQWSSPGGLLMAQVRMFYNDSISGEAYPVSISVGAGSLPAQGIDIDSTGSSGDSTRKVHVFRGYPEPPFVFDTVVFSEGSIN